MAGAGATALLGRKLSKLAVRVSGVAPGVTWMPGAAAAKGVAVVARAAGLAGFAGAAVLMAAAAGLFSGLGAAWAAGLVGFAGAAVLTAAAAGLLSGFGAAWPAGLAGASVVVTATGGKLPSGAIVVCTAAAAGLTGAGALGACVVDGAVAVGAVVVSASAGSTVSWNLNFSWFRLSVVAVVFVTCKAQVRPQDGEELPPRCMVHNWYAVGSRLRVHVKGAKVDREPLRHPA